MDVEEAKGKMLEIVEVAWKKFAVSRPANNPSPNTPNAAPGVSVPTPNLAPLVKSRMPVFREKVSEASERRNERESTESSVVASVQLEVTATSLALEVIQVPAPTPSEPAEMVSPAPSRAVKLFVPRIRVEVAFTMPLRRRMPSIAPP